MGREENVSVFQDTEKLCRTNGILVKATEQTIAAQKVIPETDSLPDVEHNRYANDAAVIVSKKRSFEAAVQYKGQKTAVHNFASASNPGGGVERGANAQEECLCRCSNLYFCLNTPDMVAAFYHPHRKAHDPMHNDDIILTPNVTVFKTDTANPQLMPESDWYHVDVITCAAPNLREEPGNIYNSGDGSKRLILQDDELLALHKKRLRRILDAALTQGVETVILGAFGCGAFANKPQVVAEAAKQVIGDYLKAFKNIEFAIFCRSWDEENYKIFARVLEPLAIKNRNCKE